MTLFEKRRAMHYILLSGKTARSQHYIIIGQRFSPLRDVSMQSAVCHEITIISNYIVTF
jgi:hypothetical protein